MSDGKYLETIWVCPKCKESRGTECNGPTKCKSCNSIPIAVSLYTGHLRTISQQSLSGSADATPKSCATCCHKYENRNEPPCYQCYDCEHWEAHDF